MYTIPRLPSLCHPTSVTCWVNVPKVWNTEPPPRLPRCQHVVIAPRSAPKTPKMHEPRASVINSLASRSALLSSVVRARRDDVGHGCFSGQPLCGRKRRACCMQKNYHRTRSECAEVAKVLLRAFPATSVLQALVPGAGKFFSWAQYRMYWAPPEV